MIIHRNLFFLEATFSGVAAQCLGAVVGVIPDGFLGNVKVELSEVCQGKISGVYIIYLYINISYIYTYLRLDEMCGIFFGKIWSNMH